METKTATYVKTVPGAGEMRIYKCDPPMAYRVYSDSEPRSTEYVAVSAASVPFSGTETYIFPSDGDDVSDWGELEGSFRGGWDHEEALRGAGYAVS